jgi:integrase
VKSISRSGEAPRSLPIGEWPVADQQAWRNACRLGSRFNRGGAASHLAEESQADIANRYGAFLGFLRRTGRLDRHKPAGAQVTSQNVDAYLSDLNTRVRLVTAWNAIYKLRRAAELVTGAKEFSWLAEIEKDLALVMQPRSKFDRLVFTDRLVEAGLTLAIEAAQFGNNGLTGARGVRNGLMVALLAFCPIRLKNFAGLEIGRTFKEAQGSWWIALPSISTKSRRPDERRVPAVLNQWVELYFSQSRPVLIGARPDTNALWISSRTGNAFTRKNLGTLISKVTGETIGVDVSPHLFRTAAASTAVARGGPTPHLASAILNHSNPRVTSEHYERGSSASAAQTFADMIESIVQGFGGDHRCVSRHRSSKRSTS